MNDATQIRPFDVDSFCDFHRMSRRLLYQLWSEGRGPRVMKVGRRTLISAEAAAEWRKQMEEATPMCNGGAK